MVIMVDVDCCLSRKGALMGIVGARSLSMRNWETSAPASQGNAKFGKYSTIYTYFSWSFPCTIHFKTRTSEEASLQYQECEFVF